ncbi:MAG: SDR family NAD(P)-dependent oxidoreductase [Rothia sp. (in: high G+C Gram-positive bacteria)]|nr:SDR family NAD(P)-dependent oxidoreductase [Rothia sp. (in: high G+C Gram-positive bacteria)]
MRQVALVTGASAGIGFHLASHLAQRSYDIIAVGASDRVHQVPEKISDVDVYPVQADLTKDAGIEALWGAYEELGRPLDVVALNAGKSLGGAFHDTDLDEELYMLNLNVVSQIKLAKRVVRTMAQQKNGHLLITSSMSALTPTPFESIYGPTRAFMYSFAQGLREEMKDYNVSVTALLPGATATEFHHTAKMDNTKFGDNSWKNDPAEVARQGIEGLFAGADHVIGGTEKTRKDALRKRTMSEVEKAQEFALSSRPNL